MFFDVPYSMIHIKIRWLRSILLVLTVSVLVSLSISAGTTMQFNADWRTADRSSAGLAPDPTDHPEAIVQIYAARAFGWRGIFAVHSWIATKAEQASGYTIYQVMGWRGHHGGGPNIVVGLDIPDRHWFGNKPWIIAELYGDTASAAILKIEQAVRNYPYVDEYVLWPGPNSNTFVAAILRQVPELNAEMPPTAIGKDYLLNGALVAPAPSGSGYQFSLLGVLGMLIGKREGLELNLLGLIIGIDPFAPAIKLPGIGRLGF